MAQAPIKIAVMEKQSTISIRETKELKTVKIASNSKPDIDSSIINKWQSLIDTLAKLLDVPSGLIMRLNETTIDVFLKSNTKGNPYKVGEEAELTSGLYCETVVGTQKELLVPDATKSPIWKNNPDVDLNMISYLGVPINWPDGESFGTVCVLDEKENHYTADFKDLLSQIRDHIETDLQMLMKNIALNEKKAQLEQLNSVKTKFLSLISHDVRGYIGTADEFLKLIIADFDNIKKSELLPMVVSISKNVSTSYQTLENLLNWSKNELVQLEPNIKTLNIVKLSDDVLSTFKQAIDIKNITVVKEYYSKDAHISGDKKMFNVILRNLISNAVKYSNANDTIYIRIRLVDKQHIIEIEDTGIGMNQSTIDNLFSYDKTHKKQGTKGESSAGIGLMLVKEFIDKNNAKIGVESEIGKGSIFRIVI